MCGATQGCDQPGCPPSAGGSKGEPGVTPDPNHIGGSEGEPVLLRCCHPGVMPMPAAWPQRILDGMASSAARSGRCCACRRTNSLRKGGSCWRPKSLWWCSSAHAHSSVYTPPSACAPISRPGSHHPLIMIWTCWYPQSDVHVLFQRLLACRRMIAAVCAGEACRNLAHCAKCNQPRYECRYWRRQCSSSMTVVEIL